MGGGFWNFDKDFIKNTRKRGPAGKHFGFFTPRNSTQRWAQQGLSFKNQDIFFNFEEGQGLPSPASLVASP